jgi:hypothetical protein
VSPPHLPRSGPAVPGSPCRAAVSSPNMEGSANTGQDGRESEMVRGGQDKIRRLNFYTTRQRTTLHGTFHYTVIVHTAHTQNCKYRYIACSTQVTVSLLVTSQSHQMAVLCTSCYQPVLPGGSVMY